MRKMSDGLRIKEVESLLDRYYKSEDSFEQTELAISIIQGHVGHLLNSLKQNKRYREALEFYAKPKNWLPQNEDVLSLITMDYGEKARVTLEGESE